MHDTNKNISEKNEIMRQALENIRKTREKLTSENPEVLRKMEEILKTHTKNTNISEAGQADLVEIDKNKNAETVYKFLNIKREQSDLTTDTKTKFLTLLKNIIH